MNPELIQVNAFAEKPFTGNPAAVCLLPDDFDASDKWMQQVATEMRLSETAFLRPESTGYHLRWFTPVCEVDLCGHATLASAHVLWENGLLAAGETARFRTRSGELTAVRSGDGIEMDFPADPATACDPPEGLLQALGIEAAYVGRASTDYLIEVDRAETLRRIKPNFSDLAKIPARGIIVTARSDGAPFDFISRFFAPAAGVDEDPVTGSAHCTLAPYWAGKLNQTELNAHQASPRGGGMKAKPEGHRVRLIGKAVTMWRGEWVG